MTKPIIYVDMDGTIVDFAGFFEELAATGVQIPDPLDAHPEVFAKAKPMPLAIDALTTLAPHFDLYILTTSPWDNPHAPSQKLAWIKKHFGDGPDSIFYKKVIISHNKHLNHGDYLIDDRVHPKFTGIQILFGKTDHPIIEGCRDWQEVTNFLLAEISQPPVQLG